MINSSESGKFLDIIADAPDIACVEAKYGRNPFVKLSVEVNGEARELLASKSCGQLADQLGIPRKEFWAILRAPRAHRRITVLLRRSKAKIKISASCHEGTWWIHLFATPQHITVTFQEILSVVKEIFPTAEMEVKREGSHSDNCFVIKGPKGWVKVLAGTNTKAHAMSVRVTSRAGNTRVLLKRSIKRTKEWEARLTETLREAKELAF